MKGKKIVELVVKLVVICALSALILSFINSKTAPVVAERKNREFVEAFGQVYPEGDKFTESDKDDLLNDNITKIVEVEKSGKQVGYVIGVTANGGYGGDIEFIIGIQNDGLVKGFKILKSQETTEFGGRIEKEEYTKSVVGSMFNQGIVANGDGQGENEVQALSGATITTTAMTKALNIVVETMGKLSDEIGEVDTSKVEAPKEELKLPSKEELLANLEGADGLMLIDEESIKNDVVKNAFEISSPDKKAIAIQVVSKGFGGNINFTLTISDDKVQAINITEANETAGFGKKIEDDSYKEKVLGKTIDELSNVDAISGATVTSKAMKKGYDAIVEAYKALKEMEYKTKDFSSQAEGEDSNEGEDPILTLIEGANKKEEKAENVYELSNDQGVLGIVVKATSEKGFGGPITFAVAFDDNDKVIGFKVIEDSETAGFGKKIEDDSYKEKVLGKTIDELSNVDAISGATITSKAMKAGFDEVIETYGGYRIIKGDNNE